MNELILLSVSSMLFSFQNQEKNSEASRVNENKKPNILFLFADDQRADALGCSGNSYIKTPNIDKLSDSGVRFTNCYVMGGHHGAICAPSRAMLMSGKSLFHVYDQLDDVLTMPKYFAQNGYETFGTGKWHNGAKSFEASFQKGENVFLGGMCDHFKVPCQSLGADGKLGKQVIKGFSTDMFAEAAVNFLTDYSNSPKENPFFCYVAFTAPHDPRSPREDYIGIYPAGTIPLPGNFKALHPFAYDNLNVRDETLAPWPRTPEVIQESLSDYYSLISHMDSRIGDIIETLKMRGLFEKTIIIYAADNGLAIGSHGLLGKQNLYEHSTKVPLIISGPDIPKKEASAALVYLFDIFPTLASLCKLPAPKGIDGKNMVDLIKGKEKEIRSSLYTAYRNTVRAVRTEEWKLIRYPHQNFTQLFNLKNDPLELNNLAKNQNYSAKVDEMMSLMEIWYKLSNDTATMSPKTILPLEYDHKKLKQTPDRHQPESVLEKYFRSIEVNDTPDAIR